LQILRWFSRRVPLLFAIVIAACVEFAIDAADARAQGAETFTVTSLLDAGSGSLRAAIDAANASTATTKLITFSVPENSTINLNSNLPEITDGVTIDGRSVVNLKINGTGTTRIFRIGADTTTVRDVGLAGAPLQIGSGASLSLDISTDQQFDQVITDAGRLVKDGDAMLTLRGANDYSGGTLISKGTLRGDTTSLQGAITNNATLTFDQTVSGTYAGIVSGAGSVKKTGTGEVTFSGANTYTGGTTISGGALRGDATSLQGDIAVETNGTVIFDQPSDATYAGNLTGAGKFTKEGVGTLTLSGANTISGQSNLDAGILKGTFSSIPLNLATAMSTEVMFDQSTSGSYAGAISGSAAVTKTGTGTLTLSGANSYTGVTTVTGGTLSGTPASLPNLASSMIMNDATLILQGGGTGAYLGVISGTGSLTKSGGGTLTLSNAHTFSGPTSVAGGRLDVNGSLGAGAVDVSSGAVLGGTGSIGGPVTLNGTVAPGSALTSTTFGTLSVGSISFASSSVFEVDVNAAGMADKLAVAGNADLGGASLKVNPGAGSYAAMVSKTILTAASISNDFAPINSNLAFLDIDFVTGTNTVDLTIVSNGMTLADYAQTPNQSTISAALEAAQTAPGHDPDLDTVFESFNVLTVDQVPGVIDSLTGESLTQFATTRLATAERFGRSLDARIRDYQRQSNRALWTVGLGSNQQGPLAIAPSREASPALLGVALLGVGAMGAPDLASDSESDSWIRSWIDGSAIYGNVDGDGNASDFDYDIWGGSFGTDLRLAEHWILGVAGGYAATNLDFSASPGDNEVDTYQAALYAGYVDPRFYVGVSGRYAYNDIDAKREISFGAIDRKAHADLNGDDYGARFESGLNLLELGGAVLQPTVSVSYNHLTQDGFSESGAMSLDLAVEDFDVDSLVTGVGLRVHGRWKLGTQLWMVPELRGRWLHEFLDTDRLIEAQLVSAPSGAAAFEIQGVELPRDAGSVGVAWSVITGAAWSVVGSYDAVLNGDLVQHVGSIAVNFEW